MNPSTPSDLISSRKSNIIKSILSETIGSVGVHSKKSGKELRTRIESLKSECDLRYKMYEDLCQKLRSALTAVPLEELSFYEYRKYKASIKSRMIYSWEQCNLYDKANAPKEVTSYTDTESQEKVGSTENICRQYNGCVRKCVEEEINLILLKNALSSIDDKKDYYLSIEQAATLGF